VCALNWQHVVAGRSWSRSADAVGACLALQAALPPEQATLLPGLAVATGSVASFTSSTIATQLVLLLASIAQRST
jgi:hypothetical protein